MSDMSFMAKLLDGVEVEWKQLGEIAEYSKIRISCDRLDKNNHVGVDNLLQNRAGKTESSHVPTEGNLIEYCSGDILIGNIRPYLKKIWHADRVGGTNGDVLVIHPTNEAINSRYLYQVLTDEKFFGYNMQYAKGAKMPRGNKTKILEYPVPFPCPDNPKKSLEIQAEIVRILDVFTELTTELTTELSARKKQYNYYRDKLLTFEEGEVEWKTLKEVASFTNGKGHEKDIVEDGKYIVVNSKFISTDGKVAKFSDKQISPLFSNDILIVMSDLPNGKALARTFYVNEDERYTLNQRIGGIRVVDEKVLLPKFLYYYLNRIPQLLKFDDGASQTNLRKDQILGVKIPIPFPDMPEKSIEEQARIVGILDKFETLTNSISEGLPREIELRQKQYAYYRDLLLSFPKAEATTASHA